MDNLWEIVQCPDTALFEEASAAAGLGNASYAFRDSYFSDVLQYGNVSSSNNASVTPGYFTFDAAQVNLTFPCVDMTDLPTKDMFKRVMTKLNTYFTPVVIVIGATGNLLAFLVFTVTHLRRQSSSVYLASLALADMGFLLSLFIVWLRSVKVHLFTRHVWCQTVVYLTYICTFLSVWYVVSFTVERYIIVWYPLRKDRFCTTKRARIVVITLAFAACVIYSFAPWTSGVVEVLRVPICIPFPHYYHFLTAMEGIDSALTLIIPSTVVIFLNIRIIIKIISVDRQRRPFIRRNNYTARYNKAPPGGGGGSDQQYSVHEPLSAGGHIVHVKFRNQTASSDRPTAGGGGGGGPGSSVNNVGSNSPELKRFSHSHSQSSDKNRFVGGLRTLTEPAVAAVVGEKHRCCGGQINCLEKHHLAAGGGGGGAAHHHHHHPPDKHWSCVQKLSERPNFTETNKSMSTTEIFRKCHARVHVRNHSQYRTARMLIVVSSVFVVLNLPSHVFRIHAFIQTSLADQLASRGHTDVRWHELFQLVYHLNFAINFFIYSVCGRQFRTGLGILYSRLVHKLTKCRRGILHKASGGAHVV